MKNNQLIVFAVLGVLLLVGVIGGVLILSNNDNATQDNTTNTNIQNRGSDNTDTTNPNGEETTQGGGIYTDYDESLIAADKTNVLFFKADWCPTCSGLDRDINANFSSIPENVQIFEVPYDNLSGATQEDLDLGARYGVDYQHTLIQVDGDLNEITQWSGSPTLADILDNIQ